MEIGRKSNLEPGYVFAPYIPMSNITVTVDSSTRRYIRRRKIRKILNLKDDDSLDVFPLNKSIMSRYSKKIINSKYYGVIEIKKPTY